MHNGEPGNVDTELANGHAGSPKTRCFSPEMAMLAAPTPSWCIILFSAAQKARRPIVDPSVRFGAITLISVQ